MADGHVLLITGASTGIGAATARMAGERGFRLVLTARSGDKLNALVKEIGDDKALAVPCDVANWEDQARAATAAIDRFGAIDAVFANAGRGGVPGGYAEGDPNEWHDMIMTNVYGLALTLRATLDHLKTSKGDLLITSSIAGRRPLPGSVYGATKWAATAIGYNARAELQSSGVRVTLIEPGIVDTPFFEEPKPDGLRPEDVARTVLFALEQPRTVLLNELVVVPSAQKW